MTYGQFKNCLDGYNKRIEVSDALNHILGKYFRIAMSDKKYPDKPFLSGDKHSSGKLFTDDDELDNMIDAQIKQQG